MSQPRLLHIFVYPVKGCRAIELEYAMVCDTGLAYDRAWMFCDPNGRFITQRDCVGLVRIQPGIASGKLTLTDLDSGSTLQVSDEIESPMIGASVWDDTVSVHDCGPEAAEWSSGILSRPLRLVRQSQSEQRVLGSGRYANNGVNSLSDSYPYHIVTTASLEALSNEVGDQIPASRFRPNFVIDGATAWEEDTWTDLRIGDIDFGIGKPTGRCVVTTIDQDSGSSGKEPLRTLASIRRDSKGKVLFGTYAVALASGGLVRIGDVVSVTRSTQKEQGK